MRSNTIAIGLVKAVGILVAFAIILYLLYMIKAVLIYLLVALILTLLGSPILRFLKRRLKFPNTLASAAVLFLFVLIMAGFIMMFVPLIISQGQNLAVLNAAQIEQNLITLYNQFLTFLESHNIDSQKLIKESDITSSLSFAFIPAFFNSFLGILGNLGMALASIFFITFFFLKDRMLFERGARKLLPDSHEEKILNSLEKINHLLSRYFIGLLMQLSVIFVLYMIVLFIFGVENAVVIAFLCAVLNIIPYVGPLLASIIAALLTMLSNLGGDFSSDILPTTIYVLIGFSLVQVIDNNFSSPMIFSNSVKSHPLEIFLVILIAGFMSGILGMIVAVPVYTILKVIGKEFFPENTLVRLLTKDI